MVPDALRDSSGVAACESGTSSRFVVVVVVEEGAVGAVLFAPSGAADVDAERLLSALLVPVLLLLLLSL